MYMNTYIHSVHINRTLTELYDSERERESSSFMVQTKHDIQDTQ